MGDEQEEDEPEGDGDFGAVPQGPRGGGPPRGTPLLYDRYAIPHEAPFD